MGEIIQFNMKTNGRYTLVAGMSRFFDNQYSSINEQLALPKTKGHQVLPFTLEGVDYEAVSDKDDNDYRNMRKAWEIQHPSHDFVIATVGTDIHARDVDVVEACREFMKRNRLLPHRDRPPEWARPRTGRRHPALVSEDAPTTDNFIDWNGRSYAWIRPRIRRTGESLRLRNRFLEQSAKRFRILADITGSTVETLALDIVPAIMDEITDELLTAALETGEKERDRLRDMYAKKFSSLYSLAKRGGMLPRSMEKSKS